MKHTDFQISREFYYHGCRWRCTDIGTRTIAGIRVEFVRVTVPPAEPKMLTYEEADAAGWFNGPPYAVYEKLFDEDDQKACQKQLEEGA